MGPPADAAVTPAAESGLDALTAALGGALPELGALTGFVFLVILLLRRETQLDSRHTGELTRISTLHDAEVAELRAENARLREQRDVAEELLRESWRRRDAGPAP